jgi:hypothetical protein
MPDPFDLLEEQVHGLDGPVGAAIGGMPGQELGLPRLDHAGKPYQLRHANAVCPTVETLERGAGRRRADRGVDRPQQLLALPARGDLASGISSRQASP